MGHLANGAPVVLIGFENRILVLTRWTFSFITHGRGRRASDHRWTRGINHRQW